MCGVSGSLPGRPPERPRTVVTVCENGPLLVRGDVEIIDAAGDVIPRTRSTIALCRCGNSRIAPFCDGTHKLSRRGRSMAPPAEPGPWPER